MLAARRAGVKKVVLPVRNRQDLEDIPEGVREDVELIFVGDVREAITEVLTAGLKQSNTFLKNRMMPAR